jgi:uncharacterized protein (DUF58 family)
VSAFRGGGIEFEESRPYVPGDDVRTIDWNATARTGEPWVKRFREERSRTVLIALDVSASMAFRSGGRSKATLAACATALLSAAAARAGDKLGLVGFAGRVLVSVPPASGEAHSWRVTRAAVAATRTGGGSSDLEPALEWLGAHAHRRSVVVLLSDFRDERSFGATEPAPPARLSGLARRHDVVAVICEDPRERELCRAGPVRLVDPEGRRRPFTLAMQSRRLRVRYREAAAAWRRLLERELRAAGLDWVRLSTERDPLPALADFFRRRAAHLSAAS